MVVIGTTTATGRQLAEGHEPFIMTCSSSSLRRCRQHPNLGHVSNSLIQLRYEEKTKVVTWGKRRAASSSMSMR